MDKNEVICVKLLENHISFSFFQFMKKILKKLHINSRVNKKPKTRASNL